MEDFRNLSNQVNGSAVQRNEYTLSPEDWHARFTRQARWTQDLRQYLYGRISIQHARRILEVGCGTGALLDELQNVSGKESFGLDIRPDHVSLATRNSPGAYLTCGDGLHLPFPNNTFDVVLCHFLLMWVPDPVQVVQEMARVTITGGDVLALAEPDYGGRVDFPPELVELGQWQMDALHRQGADPIIGRKLAGIFIQAGLAGLETGVVGGQWFTPPSTEERASEWKVIRSDLGDVIDMEKLEELHDLDAQAYKRGERILFVPTFYAWGKVR